MRPDGLCHMISKVLIANRGEIVRRVARACGDLGLRTAPSTQTPTPALPYTRQAEEAYRIGEAIPIKSYLNIEALVGAIKDSGADAVHPGYGFLSENADFAEAVERAGAVWVGPPSSILRAIESKCYCRQIATGRRTGGAGLDRGPATPDDVRRLAARLNYPILLKLDRGGGGKGIERVEGPEQIVEVFERVQRIGAMAFGNPDVYVERRSRAAAHRGAVPRGPRGNVVCLGERECSIQRRHQKIIEESPSPVVTPAQSRATDRLRHEARARHGLRGGRDDGVPPLGTGNFYFMEVNARLQVEHPVSEFVTGHDIVQWQLRIADGERLDVHPGRRRHHGPLHRGALLRRGAGHLQALSGHHHRAPPSGDGQARAHRPRPGGRRHRAALLRPADRESHLVGHAQGGRNRPPAAGPWPSSGWRGSPPPSQSICSS